MKSESREEHVICLFSGGLDSTTMLYDCINRGYEVHCLSFDYAQRHRKELEAARAITTELGVDHRIVSFTLPWGGSSLTDAALDVPVHDLAEIGSSIPLTYVPARNILFLSFAASWAEVLGVSQIFIGANQLDYSGYPDCRGEFLQAYQQMLRIGTRCGVEGAALSVQTPLLEMTKKDIVQMAKNLKVPIEKTWSCYQGEDEPCGQCDSCQLRKQAGISLGEGVR